MAVVNGYRWRAITLRQAQHIGTSASVAGGYVAVEGPRVERITEDEYHKIFAEWGEWGPADEDFDPVREQSRFHRLHGGDYAAVGNDENPGQSLILVLPADHKGFSDYGYALPESLVQELIPLLAARGYATTAPAEAAR